MTPLTWTSSLPTVPGWYWWWDSTDPYLKPIVGIVGETQFPHQLFMTGYWNKPIHEMKGEWAGPIPLPGEKEG